MGDSHNPDARDLAARVERLEGWFVQALLGLVGALVALVGVLVGAIVVLVVALAA